MGIGSGIDQKNARIRELTIPADESQLSRVRDFVAAVCAEAGFTAGEVNNTKLAVDEACTNIIKHAYDDSTGRIRVRAAVSPGRVDFSLLDRGKRFDFAGVKDPDLEHYVETGRKGGLGVFLINRLMDSVEYRAGRGSNELLLSKTSLAVASRAIASRISWRGSLRYRFTLRASLGLFVIIASIWGYIFMRQTEGIKAQRTTHWMEKRRLAEAVANKSRALLLNPQMYSIEQTTLTAFIAQIMDGNDDLAYLRVLDLDDSILSSADIEEISTRFSEKDGQVLLEEGNGVRWMQIEFNGEVTRDIRFPVRARNQDTGRLITVGNVYVGAYEHAMYRAIPDPRPLTTAIILVSFLAGLLLIVALVTVFVKPIQELADGVRAIGQGSLDGKIDVGGPAEIGAIATVLNDITEKFREAQANVLEQEKLQKEIEVAKQIQHSLLPSDHPAVSGYDIAPYYQAANEVGGDYYDFVQVDEGALGVVVADVSGKGVPGSLVMTMIRTALRMEARGNKNASDVMSKMNAFVTDDMKKGMFVTMFYVILDSKNRTISYASAGHNPMILYRGEGREIYFLNPKGFPVGISLPDASLFNRSISLEKIKLKKDDMLVIYTDGVTEAMNEGREQYGADRLVQLIKENGHLHPTRFIEELERSVKVFTGGYPQNDDITVVAIKEKLGADDVLAGIRKKLIQLVEVEGMSVKAACKKMSVSPTTYYRYKKRVALLGERGLRNKFLREDADLKMMTVEERKAILKIIVAHPDFGARRISKAYNRRANEGRQLTARMVYDELKRLDLNTKERRHDYVRRIPLLDQEEPLLKDS
jgi:serine phosphatase RsbU (regulator of sigma subunit)/anti-sigma regulatory factor (Ser/Thr protein kinase)/transposase